MSDSQRLGIGDRRDDDHDRAVEERALELAAAGSPWLAAIAQAARELEDVGAIDVATGRFRRLHGRPPGVPGRTTRPELAVLAGGKPAKVTGTG